MTVEVQSEFHVIEEPRKRTYATCRKCHHTFYAKQEDQHGLELCDRCIEDRLFLREPVISVRVKARPHRAKQQPKN